MDIRLDKGADGPMKKVYDVIGEGHQVIGQDQIQKFLYKRYKGLGAKIYKILVAPQFNHLPNLNQIRYREYADSVEGIFKNKYPDDLKMLAFQLFKQPKDVNKETNLSEQDLFALVG